MTCPACNRRDCDHVACYLEEPGDEPEICRVCTSVLNEGECPVCDVLTQTHSDPLIDAYAEYLALRSGNLGLTEIHKLGPGKIAA